VSNTRAKAREGRREEEEGRREGRQQEEDVGR